MDLERTLEEFDAVETNLRRLEKVWEEMQQFIPEGLSFYGNSPEGLRYIELQRSYAAILQGIPAIDGYSISEIEGDLDSIAQARLDALEIGEWEAKRWVEEKIDEPTREIAEYRFRFREARRELVRAHLQDLVAEINRLVSSLAEVVPKNLVRIEHEDWPQLITAFQQVERLAGSQIPQVGRWSDMRRHLRFVLPSVLIAGLLASLYAAVLRAAPGEVKVVRPQPLDCTGAGGLTAAEVRQAQQSWSKYLGRQAEEAVEVSDGVKMTFVLVPPGPLTVNPTEYVPAAEYT